MIAMLDNLRIKELITDILHYNGYSVRVETYPLSLPGRTKIRGTEMIISAKRIHGNCIPVHRRQKTKRICKNQIN